MEETSAIITFFTSHDDVFEMIGRVVLPLAVVGVPWLAYKKGRNPWFWLLLFVLLQPLAIIALLLAGKQKKCIHCGRRIDVNLKECSICGKSQEEPPQDAPIQG